MKILFFSTNDIERKYFANNNLSDFEIKFYENNLNDCELSEDILSDTDIICINERSNANSELLSKFKNLRIVANRSANCSNIDLNYCVKNRIAVLNAGGYGYYEKAEFITGVIISLLRNIVFSYRALIDNNIFYDTNGRCLKKLKIGILGCDESSLELSKILRNFDVKLLVINHKQKFSGNVSCVTYDDLLSEADVILINTMIDDESNILLDKYAFEKMKKGVYVINVSDEKLIDMNELLENLKNQKLGGVAFDSYNISLDSEIMQKLLTFKNVLITPGLSIQTTTTTEYILDCIINSIRDTCKGLYVNRVC